MSAVSPKVVASTAATLVLSLLVAVGNQVGPQPPEWAVPLLTALVPTVAAWVGGWLKADPARQASAPVLDHLSDDPSYTE